MNGMKRIVGSAVAAAIVCTAAGAAARGPQFRETLTVRGVASSNVSGEHALTFGSPIALPGVSLGAGTYIFRRPSAGILQVLNAKREPYAMMLTTPAARPEPAPHYEIVLGEPAADGSPRRLEAWFLPGESTGQQLIYRDR